jgi:hypothetical protein
MGLDYQCPNFDSPLFLIKKVFVDDVRCIAASVVKIRAEGMLLVDPEVRPELKMLAMCELQRETLTEAWRRGLDEIDAAVPDVLQFQKRLRELGWTAEREGWTVWTHKTEAPEDAVSSRAG